MFTLAEDYRRMVSRDVLPSKKSELTRILQKNPKLLLSEIEIAERPFSVISTVLQGGYLHAADFILKKNDRISPNADPLYCGKINGGGITTLLHSAGVNFYLALTTLQFYYQQNKLNSLIDTQGLVIQATHYDCLYGKSDAGERFHASFEADNSTSQTQINTYKHKTARLFMLMAYSAFQAETQLSTTISLAEKENLNKKLGDIYLQAAFMEDYLRYSFYYLLDKALEYYRATSLIDKIDYVEDCIEKRDQLLDSQRENREQLLYVEETDSYRIKTYEDWQKLYKLTHKHNNDIYLILSDDTDSDVTDDEDHSSYTEKKYPPASILRCRNNVQTNSTESNITDNRLTFTYHRDEKTSFTTPPPRVSKSMKNS